MLILLTNISPFTLILELKMDWPFFYYWVIYFLKPYQLSQYLNEIMFLPLMQFGKSFLDKSLQTSTVLLPLMLLSFALIYRIQSHSLLLQLLKRQPRLQNLRLLPHFHRFHLSWIAVFSWITFCCTVVTRIAFSTLFQN